MQSKNQTELTAPASSLGKSSIVKKVMYLGLFYATSLATCIAIGAAWRFAFVHQAHEYSVLGKAFANLFGVEII